MANCGRFRHFGIIFYGSALELDTILLRYQARISHYAYILHDKDTFVEEVKDKDGNVVHEKGELKKAHYHVLVDFYNACSANACKRLFVTTTDNPKVEIINDMVASYRYLTHKDNPEAYQYTSDCINSSDINYYEHMCIIGAKKDSDNIAMQIIEDILKKVNPRILVHRYGRDFVIHMKQYYDCAWEIQEYDRAHPVFDEQLKLPFDE